MNVTSFLTVSIALGLSAFAQDQVLFNGKDLSGWEGNPALWSVRDGVLHGETTLDPVRAPKSTLRDNTYLVWKDATPGGFELHVTFRFLSPEGNSGIQFRSKVLRQGVHGPIVAGYQANMETGVTYTGVLYDERGKGILAKRGEKVLVSTDPEHPRNVLLSVTGTISSPGGIQQGIKANDWNDYGIIAMGNHIQQFINGLQTVDVTDERPTAPKDGVIALQLHQATAMIVEFKDILLKAAR